MAHMKYGSNPNKGGSSAKTMVSPSMVDGKSGSITKSTEMRADSIKKVTNRNPYPKGLA